MAFVRRNTRNATIIDENGKRADRTGYPIVAVREIILIALIHRDYSIHTGCPPIRVVLYQTAWKRITQAGGMGALPWISW